MKRTVLVLLMVASAAALFANGNVEPPNAGAMTGPEWVRSRDGFDGEFARPANAVFTPIEVTGTVSMMDDHAVLTADGETYLLAIPRIAWYADEVADGTVITVTGSLIEGVDHDQVDFDGDGYIAVDQVEIDGAVISLGAPNGPGRTDARRGNFADDNAYGRRGMADDSFGRGAYADDDRGMPGRGQMPRGRRI